MLQRSTTLHQEHLGRDEVHVWRVDLDCPTLDLHRYAGLLGADELARSRRFRYERDRARFVARRAALRLILGSYVGVDASALRFTSSARGKPLLVAADGTRDLRFSVARSQGIAIVAVTRGRELGVDVERIREVPEAESIAELFFAASDTAVPRARAPRERDAHFIARWTQVEAFLKATGEGIARTRGILELAWIVSAELMTERDAGEAELRAWSARAITLDEDYLATLVVEGNAWTLVHKHWTHDRVVP